MSEKTEKKEVKIPKAVVALIIAVPIVIAACMGVFIYLTVSNSEKPQEPTTVSSEFSEEQLTTEQELTSEVKIQESTDSELGERIPEESEITATTSEQEIVLREPESGAQKTYFSAIYTPYKAIDMETYKECSLKEVFGSSYSTGGIVFNSNGTFTDDLIITSANTGAYYAADNNIVATYSNDKNMDITVLVWNENIPERFIVNYGGYDVYFS